MSLPPGLPFGSAAAFAAAASRLILHRACRILMSSLCAACHKVRHPDTTHTSEGGGAGGERERGDLVSGVLLYPGHGRGSGRGREERGWGWTLTAAHLFHT